MIAVYMNPFCHPQLTPTLSVSLQQTVDKTGMIE